MPRADKAPPSFPLYYKDAYTDATFVAWGWDAQGLFWRLACWQWDDGSIPDDVNLVAAIVGKDKETRRLWPAVLERFAPVEGMPGRLRNAKVHELREKMLEDRARKQAGAKKTNTQRWGAKSLTDRSATAAPERKAAPVAEDGFDVIAGFERIFARYPVRNDRSIAEMQYAASVHSEADHARIEKALDRYIAYAKAQEQSWMRAGRWFEEWEAYETIEPTARPRLVESSLSVGQAPVTAARDRLLARMERHQAQHGARPTREDRRAAWDARFAAEFGFTPDEWNEATEEQAEAWAMKLGGVA